MYYVRVPPNRRHDAKDDYGYTYRRVDRVDASPFRSGGYPCVWVTVEGRVRLLPTHHLIELVELTLT